MSLFPKKVPTTEQRNEELLARVKRLKISDAAPPVAEVIKGVEAINIGDKEQRDRPVQGTLEYALRYSAGLYEADHDDPSSPIQQYLLWFRHKTEILLERQ